MYVCMYVCMLLFAIVKESLKLTILFTEIPSLKTQNSCKPQQKKIQINDGMDKPNEDPYSSHFPLGSLPTEGKISININNSNNNNKKVITTTTIITIMKIIKIQKVIAVIIAIMNNIKSFNNNNSDKSYDQSYALLVQAFIKLQSFS